MSKGILKIKCSVYVYVGFPGGSVVKNLPANAGEADSIPGSRRPPGEGNNNPFQYVCLGNSMDRGVRWAIVHGFTKGQTRQSIHAHTRKDELLFMEMQEHL